MRPALEGVGSSAWSPGAVRQLPVEILELDPGVVAGIDSTPSGEAVVSALGGLARTLGRRLTAAGVATQQQHDVVRAAGCEHARGSLYGPVVDAAAVPALVHEGRLVAAGAPEALEAGPPAR